MGSTDDESDDRKSTVPELVCSESRRPARVGSLLAEGDRWLGRAFQIREDGFGPNPPLERNIAQTLICRFYPEIGHTSVRSANSTRKSSGLFGLSLQQSPLVFLL